MVIIHPYRVASLILAYDDVGESFVDCNVMLPTLIFPGLEFWIVGDLIMKSRPKNLFAISIIVTLQVAIRNEYRDRLLVCREILGDI